MRKTKKRKSLFFFFSPGQKICLLLVIVHCVTCSDSCEPKILPVLDEKDAFNGDYNIPPEFDLEDAAKAVTEGSGYYLVKGMFSQEDVKLARDTVSF